MYDWRLSNGPVLWIGEQRQNERLHPGGLIQFCDPARLMFAYGKTHMDVLWIAEEALRSKFMPLVITQVSTDIGLTEGRRLQLAIEARDKPPDCFFCLTIDGHALTHPCMMVLQFAIAATNLLFVSSDPVSRFRMIMSFAKRGETRNFNAVGR